MNIYTIWFIQSYFPTIMQKEAQSRIKINKLLEKSGWSFLDEEKQKANIQVEAWVKLDHLWDDFEHAPRGAIDYLLLDSRGFPICVLEAKKESIHPLSAKEQARDYAISKNARFIILSNGNSHYLWDRENGNPELITEYPTQASLEHRSTYNPDVSSLADIQINAEYLAPAKYLRPYQVWAIQAIQTWAKEWKTRYLLEMATGTWKTTTSAAICKLFLQSGNAKRILFLVDRIELEDQAKKAFAEEIFKWVYFVDTIKSGEWQKCQIVVSTIQTLMAGDRYKELFSPTDFELVISDEAHRSIWGNARAVFEYFIGYKLGLTATPKDYLKGIDEKAGMSENPKALEIRNLRDTYKTFGCEAWEPTFRYDLSAWVQDGFLINPYVIDARTDVTTELLSLEWFTLEVENDDGESSEESFGIRDFEKRFFNEKTNQIFAETIIQNGLLDPLTGEFGKMLVFAVSQSHAAKIVNLLNTLAMKKWPGKYDSDFAMQVTSNVMRSQDFTKDFTNNRLSGRSHFADSTHPDYETGKTRICVTVGMMTTGYDCPDLLGVVLLRPIFSPADFVQMKGRGTRKHVFLYQETGEKAEKDKFLLLDFFGNCEYFERDFDYNKKLDLPAISQKKDGPIVIVDPPINPDDVDAGVDDKVRTETIIQVGNEWMRIDQELYRKPKHEQFEYVLQNSETIREINQTSGVEWVEEFLKSEVFNKPNEYWNPQKLRESYEKVYNTGRRITLREMISKAFGFLKWFESRDERLDTEWQKFLITERPNVETGEQLRKLKIIFETYLADESFRSIIDSGSIAGLDSYSSLVNMNDIKLVWGRPTVDAVRNYSSEYLTSAMREFSLSK